MEESVSQTKCHISCACEVERRRGGGDGVFVEDEVFCGHGLFGAGCVWLDFNSGSAFMILLGQSCNARNIWDRCLRHRVPLQII